MPAMDQLQFPPLTRLGSVSQYQGEWDMREYQDEYNEDPAEWWSQPGRTVAAIGKSKNRKKMIKTNEFDGSLHEGIRFQKTSPVKEGIKVQNKYKALTEESDNEREEEINTEECVPCRDNVRNECCGKTEMKAWMKNTSSKADAGDAQANKAWREQVVVNARPCGQPGIDRKEQSDQEEKENKRKQLVQLLRAQKDTKNT